MSKSAVRALIEWNPTSERIIQARYYSKYIKLTVIHVYAPTEDASSETQGQLVGAGKRRNGRVKNSGAEKSRTTRSLTFLRPNLLPARFDFFPPPLTAPGSPRMQKMQTNRKKRTSTQDCKT